MGLWCRGVVQAAAPRPSLRFASCDTNHPRRVQKMWRRPRAPMAFDGTV